MSDRTSIGPQLNRISPTDDDRYTDIRLALQDEGPPLPETPYGATKTAELDIQFAIDPSFGLTKSRYGWYSNENLFDSTFFSTETGKIRMETSATSGDSARLRTAFPGQYTSHTVAEPGVGARIPEEHLQFDDNNLVSLTHGEISFDVAQWSDTDVRAYTSFGISFESDATYFQLRSEDEDVEFVKQEDWNIDPLDGTGPSGRELRPERGYVYLMIYSWYGEGGYVLCIQDGMKNDLIPLHRYPSFGANKPLDAPNMPIQVTVENKNTADPIAAVVGGMQYATHGSIDESVSRTTEESRITTGNYIDTAASTTGNAIDPFAEPGRPLISLRRETDNLRARKGLEFTVNDLYLSAESDCYIFVFDEYNEDTALTGVNFSAPTSRGSADETNIEVDTEATAYTPSSNAILRGMAYVSTTNRTTQEITGDTRSNVPLEAAAVTTVVKAPGENNTDANPFLLESTERF